MKEKKKSYQTLKKYLLNQYLIPINVLILHPFKFTQFKKILDPTLTKSEKLLDHVESDVFLEYLEILEELQLGEI